MIMRANRAFLGLITFCLLAALQFANAQDSKDTQKQTQQHVVAYHVDFSLNELADGKKINTRHYSMNIASQHSMGEQVLNIGSRVPLLHPEAGKVDYIDLGTNIRVLMEFPYQGAEAAVTVRANITTLADPNETGQNPPLRQMTLSGSTPLILDKTMTIASADDPDSRHEFRLEMTVTKLN
jgi:hypothetical protein